MTTAPYAFTDRHIGPGDDADQARGPQFAQRGDQGALLRVALADDRGPHRCVVEHGAQLLLDHRPLFLDDEDLLQAPRKVLHARRLDRVGEPELVDAHAVRRERLQRDVQPAQRLHQVVVRLAGGDDAYGGAAAFDDVAVDAVHAREGAPRPRPGTPADSSGARP